MSIAFPVSSSAVDYQIFSDTSSGGIWIYSASTNSWKSIDRNIYDFSGGVPGVPTANQVVALIDIARPVVFAANFAGSFWQCNTAATAQTIFTININGTSIGSIIFAASSKTATFTSVATGSTVINAGSVLTIVAPATPDATLANASGTLAGYLL
jgi:hypothetical protein